MKRFEKLEEYSDDELIIVVHDDYENWQKEAVDYARHLLLQRGITDDLANSRMQEIRDETDELWRIELEDRRQESYSVFELIFMTLLWINHIFNDWYLYREGYIKKRKQRLYAIAGGMLLYSVFILYLMLSFDRWDEQRIREMNQIAVNDSIAKSKIDWSGLYIFLDTSIGQTNKMIWELNLQKKNSEHSAKLKLIKSDEIQTINCVGLIKENDFELFPDTTCVLFNGVTISYYDRLFTFIRDSNEIWTTWDKMRPFYHPKLNDTGLFIETTITNR